WLRPQTPLAVVKALSPWTKTPIPPPPAVEMPRLSPAANLTRTHPATVGIGALRTPTRRSWVIPGGSGKEPIGNIPSSQAQTPTPAPKMEHPTHLSEGSDGPPPLPPPESS